MGNAESTPLSSGTGQPGLGTAFHVLRVAEQSPAAEAGIDPFFDFLCGVNGKPLGDEIDSLTEVLERSEGTSIVLQVWSTKRRELRNVQLVPSRSWSTSGASTSQPSLLGLSLRLCNPQHALEQVWHVLDILEGSPAQSAGLVPFGDWIVGYAGGVLRGEGDFYDVVEAHVDKPLRLFVYNADYDVTREAILVPNRSWGGEGLLGCGVGYGLLHRIPKPQDRAAEPLDSEDTFEGIGGNVASAGFDEEESYAMAGTTRRGSATTAVVDDGYDVASYEGGAYDASEGVQVVAVEEEDFLPAQSYAQQNSRNGPMSIPAFGERTSGKGYNGYKAPPRSPSSATTGRGGGVGAVIEEE